MHTTEPAAGQALAHSPTPLTYTPTPLAYPPAHDPGAALTLYQVAVPGAIEVALPDGRTAWARPVTERLDPLPHTLQSAQSTPAWAKALALASGSLTVLALGGAVALRIAAPALGGLVDLLETLWHVALVLAVILFGAGASARHLFARRTSHDHTSSTTPHQVVFAPQITTSGTRLLGRSGDVNIQIGDRNKH